MVKGASFGLMRRGTWETITGQGIYHITNLCQFINGLHFVFNGDRNKFVATKQLILFSERW